jgi:hypothetical protein
MKRFTLSCSRRFPLKKSFILVLATIMVAVLGLTACEKSDQNQVLTAVRNFAKYTNEEDAGSLFLLYHQAQREIKLKNLIDLQFALYDITYDFEKLELDRIEDGYAYAPFTATMKKNDDSDFRDIRITGTFVLTKEGDDWKILTIDYETEFLED